MYYGQQFVLRFEPIDNSPHPYFAQKQTDISLLLIFGVWTLTENSSLTEKQPQPTTSLIKELGKSCRSFAQKYSMDS